MFTTPQIDCDIELSHATRIFYSGDQVCGKITLHASKKMQLEGISINLAGFEFVHWSENVAKTQFAVTSYDDSTVNEAKTQNQIDYKGRKEYLLTTIQLSDNLILPESGAFVADFQIALPAELLPSCKQNNGCYRDYQLQVVLQRKSKCQKLFQKRIILRNRLDLNHVAHLNQPFVVAACCELPDQNEITFRIPKTGFVPGQLLPFSIKMTSLLYKAKIVINLCQKCAYTSQTPTTKLKDITKVLDYHIATSDEFSQLQLPLSVDISTTTTTPSTTMDHNQSLISISYYLEFLVLNENLEIAHRTLIPLTIGTVALIDGDDIDGDDVDFRVGIGAETKQIYENKTLLHYYDNLATSKYELQNQERALNKLIINFDQVTYHQQTTLKCKKYNKQRFNSEIRRLLTNIYKKIKL